MSTALWPARLHHLRRDSADPQSLARFYAELLTLQRVSALCAGPLPALFLLDEILNGTNSHDRRIGADALLRGLLARGAVGLVTTHDLALATVADSLTPRACNPAEICWQCIEG